MAANYDDIVARVSGLPLEDRARLAHWLLTSLDEGEDDDPAEVERLWAEEIERRVGELERGEAETYPAEEVLAEARRLLK